MVPAATSNQLAVKMSAKNLTAKQVMGWQSYVADKMVGRQTESSSWKNLVVVVRADSVGVAKIAIVTKDALVFSHIINADSEWREVKIPVSSMQVDSLLLLPRPYPGFLPLWFKSAATGRPDLWALDKLQFVCYGEGKGIDIEVASVRLED
jgi:hypothetical protein